MKALLSAGLAFGSLAAVAIMAMTTSAPVMSEPVPAAVTAAP